MIHVPVFFYKYRFRHSKVNVGDTQTNRQHGDRIIVFLFLHTKEIRLIVLNEAVTRIWTGLIRLRIASNGWFLMRWWIPSSIKSCAVFNHPSNCPIWVTFTVFRDVAPCVGHKFTGVSEEPVAPSSVSTIKGTSSLWDVSKHLPDYN
jgi:hypothetical protein